MHPHRCCVLLFGLRHRSAKPDNGWCHGGVDVNNGADDNHVGVTGDVAVHLNDFHDMVHCRNVHDDDAIDVHD